MRTQADRDEDLALGRELERKDAEIARLQGIIDNAFANLEVASAAPADEIARLRAENSDLQADAVRLHKLATDRWEALLEMQCRDDRNGSLPAAYRKIIDDALRGCEQKADRT